MAPLGIVAVKLPQKTKYVHLDNFYKCSRISAKFEQVSSVKSVKCRTDPLRGFVSGLDKHFPIGEEHQMPIFFVNPPLELAQSKQPEMSKHVFRKL